MLRTSQLLGCAALMSALALAPAVMAKGGAGAAAGGSAIMNKGPAASPLHAYAGPRAVSMSEHATPVRFGPRLEPPHMYPGRVPVAKGPGEAPVTKGPGARPVRLMYVPGK